MSARVIDVALPFSEAGFSPRRFSSLAAANAFLRSIAPPELGYWKTDFIIAFDDGTTYEGRFDIGADSASLEAHVLAFCKFMLRSSSLLEPVQRAYWQCMEQRFKQLFTERGQERKP